MEDPLARNVKVVDGDTWSTIISLLAANNISIGRILPHPGQYTNVSRYLCELVVDPVKYGHFEDLYPRCQYFNHNAPLVKAMSDIVLEPIRSHASERFYKQ